MIVIERNVEVALTHGRDLAAPARTLHRFELWVVLAVSLLVFLPAVFRVPFHGDESQQIASSGYLKLFLQGRFSDPAWNEGFWTLSVPPMSPYFIAVGRFVGGYGDEELNGFWDSNLDDVRNVAAGNMPGIGLLRWSRLPMALLAALTVVILFGLIKRSAGMVAAYLFAVLFLLNPYMRITLVRAMSEAPLLAFVAMAVLAGERMLHHGQLLHDVGDAARRRYLLWALMLGIASGLASASKLNGLAIVAPATVLALVGPLVPRRGQPVHRDFVLALLGAGIVIVSACLTFVLVNPFLYSDPVGRLAKMFTHRVALMNFQVAHSPQARMPDGGARLHRLALRVFETYSVLPQAGVLGANSVLTVIGLGVTLGWVFQWGQGANRRNGVVVLGLIGFSLVGPALLTSLDWDRYYLFPVVFSTWLIAIGLTFLAQRLVAVKTRPGEGSS